MADLQTEKQAQAATKATISGNGTGKVSLPEIFWQRVDEREQRVFLHRRLGSGWQAIKWQELASDVSRLARALIAFGIKPGDRVALLSNTRYEWTVCDYALLSVGAITVPIYQTSSAEEVEYILNDSGTRLLILEDQEQAAKVTQSIDRLGQVERILQIEGTPTAGDRWQSVDDFCDLGADVDEIEVRSRAGDIGPDDVATYIYTSGTTGMPKGCVITHWNFVSCQRSVLSYLPGLFTEEDSTLLFLPLAHGFARMVQFASIDSGMQIYYGNIAELSQELLTAKPSFFISVPRMFEKAYNGVQSKAAGSKLGALVFKLATTIAEPISKSKERGGGVPLALKAPHMLCDALIFSKVRAALGGNVRYAVSGGAPLAANISHFFNAAGITILEGYGLTETAPASTVNTPQRYKIGSVGVALACNEVEIADDGEVLMRGDNIFQGYYGDEAKSAEALEGGWFHSGDLGEIDSEGFLYITGRKKDLIITAGGKNITPTLVEDKLKECRYISQSVMIGDKRPFCVALITLDPDELASGNRAEIEKAIADHIKLSNESFGRVEQIKKYKILERDFTIDDGEITPTLKVKRAKIQELYADTIDALYA